MNEPRWPGAAIVRPTSLTLHMALRHSLGEEPHSLLRLPTPGVFALFLSIHKCPPATRDLLGRGPVLTVFMAAGTGVLRAAGPPRLYTPPKCSSPRVVSCFHQRNKDLVPVFRGVEADWGRSEGWTCPAYL